MTAPAAFKASYSDLRFVKSRKVAQICLELPIEEADAFVTAFGTPNPASETWVAIARLDLSQAQAPASEPEKPKRKLTDFPPAQQAGMLCKRPAFWRFLSEKNGGALIVREDIAATVLRRMCGVVSRSELATNEKAAAKFVELTIEFEDWMRSPL